MADSRRMRYYRQTPDSDMHDAKMLEHDICALKSEFASSYTGGAHLYEAVPADESSFPAIPQKDLDILHKFADANPMYENSHTESFSGVKCTVYEGDMSTYWLDSIKHDTSYAPFYPTWILSAYALAKCAADMGVRRAVDIGSGDGRIAYCAQNAGMDSLSVEIDENLTVLQRTICGKTGVTFDTRCSDATRTDYSDLSGEPTAFFIGGLPEVGEMLARGVIEKTVCAAKSVYVLAGTLVPRSTGRDNRVYGWGHMMEEFGLEEAETLVLPTRWTVEQPKDTPYVFAVQKT